MREKEAKEELLDESLVIKDSSAFISSSLQESEKSGVTMLL